MKKLEFNTASKKTPNIEITLQVRDNNGNATGETKSFASENYREVSGWYEKHRPKKKRRKRKQKGGDK